MKMAVEEEELRSGNSGDVAPPRGVIPPRKTLMVVRKALEGLLEKFGCNCPSWPDFPERLARVGLEEKDITRSLLNQCRDSVQTRLQSRAWTPPPRETTSVWDSQEGRFRITREIGAEPRFFVVDRHNEKFLAHNLPSIDLAMSVVEKALQSLVREGRVENNSEKISGNVPSGAYNKNGSSVQQGEKKMDAVILAEKRMHLVSEDAARSMFRDMGFQENVWSVTRLVMKVNNLKETCEGRHPSSPEDITTFNTILAALEDGMEIGLEGFDSPSEQEENVPPQLSEEEDTVSPPTQVSSPPQVDEDEDDGEDEDWDDEEEEDEEEASLPAIPRPEPRKRGRPKGLAGHYRKREKENGEVPKVKRGPGRPPKVRTEEETPVKRGPGRPRKNPVVETPVKRGRGRPRKNPVVETLPPIKRGPGRPPKVRTEEVPVKRGPGRPPKAHTEKVSSGPGRKRMGLSCMEAVEITLRRVGQPLSPRQLVEKMTEWGLWKTDSGNPEKAVESKLYMDMSQGKKSRFTKAGRGLFTLR